MDSIKQIAVLMRKKNIEDGVSIYFPDHIISGFIYKSDEDYDDDDNYGEETIFSDDFGEDYLLMDDPRSTFSEEDVVWHCISESDLLEKYEGLNKDEAVVRYFSDISSSIFVGFYHYARQKTIFISLNFDNLYIYLNDQVIDENFQKTILNPNNLASHLFEKYEEDEEKFNTYDDIQNPSIEAYNFISIDADLLKQLLSLTGEELKEKISTIYESYKQISEYNNTPDYEKILEKANDIYQKILSIDDIDKIKQVCSNLEDMYMEIAESLDDKYKFSNDNVKDEIENFVFKAIDICHSMSKYDDINDIKKTLSSFRDRQITHFEAMKNKQKEREKRQQELEEAFSSEDKILEEEENDLLFNPKEMKAFLDKRIIGQEEAKKDVTSAIFMNSLAEESISKNTCLLVGPTGSGKTLIASSVAEFLDLPIVNIDTTQLTVPGYVGANIEDFLTRLIESANGDVEKAQKGIVILDEIDKKGSKSNGDISGKGVLNTLLPFVQGTTYTVPYNHRKVSFDSSNLTIFMTGAFTDVAKGVNEKSLYNDSKIGFGTNRENTKDKEDIVYKKLNIEDFVEHGDFPVELVGRISNIVQLSGHTKESLKSILTDSNISVLKLEEEKLKKLNVEVKYSDDYLGRVAEKALSLKTGARSLKSTVEESIKEARWEVITASDQFKAIVLNKDCVDNNLKAILVYNDDNYTTVEDLRNKEEEKAVKKVKK